MDYEAIKVLLLLLGYTKNSNIGTDPLYWEKMI